MVGRLSETLEQYINNYSMKRIYLFIICLFIFYGCVERFEFVIKNNDPVLVVEGYVTDVSYNETLCYPSDGRYFTVKLSRTSDVVNMKSEKVSGANVLLTSDAGLSWQYVERGDGEYYLLDDDFKANNEDSYQLSVTLNDGQTYASDWQKLPTANNIMGEVTFEETSKYVYEYSAGDKVVSNKDGINVRVNIPENKTEGKRYYQWDFEPTWIYESSLFPPINKRCWVRSDFYLSNYVLQEDNKGGYAQLLFFEETQGNERFVWNFSLLVRQFLVNEDYYSFLEEMKKQGSDQLFSAPPYNLKSNMHSMSGEQAVVGYFAVARENAKRWYFNTRDLTYLIEDKIKAMCENPLATRERGPVCWDCLAYPNGSATLQRPTWWEDH